MFCLQNDPVLLGLPHRHADKRTARHLHRPFEGDMSDRADGVLCLTEANADYHY